MSADGSGEPHTVMFEQDYRVMVDSDAHANNDERRKLINLVSGKLIGVEVTLETQPDEVIANGLRQFSAEARDRGLDLPSIVGKTAIEAIANVDTTAPVTKEALDNTKLRAAYTGYADTLTALNSGRTRKEKLIPHSEEKLQTEFEAWFTPNKLIQYEAINPGIEYDVIATPNLDFSISKKDLYHMAEVFGKGQPSPTYLEKDFLDMYFDRELNGTDPANGNDFMFSLAPREYTPELLRLGVKDQLVALKKLQAKNPDAKVPSVLGAITRWYTLRANGNVNVADTELTYIHHFNLDPKRFGGLTCVPCSFVSSEGSIRGDGHPDLDGWSVRNRDNGRVAVG